MKFIKGARTWRSILGTQTFFGPLTPPPPRYSINQPLSKGLVGGCTPVYTLMRIWSTPDPSKGFVGIKPFLRHGLGVCEMKKAGTYSE